MAVSDPQIGTASTLIYALADGISYQSESANYWKSRGRDALAANAQRQVDEYRELLADIRADKVQITRVT